MNSDNQDGGLDSMTSSMPTLGVIISNFNYARYLKQTLESVLAQTRAFDEIIVVDDGSTDGSLEVLAQYAGQITVISISNGGQLGACRTAIAVSKADYLYSLDADDYAVPHLVERLQEALAKRPAKIQFQLNSISATGSSLNSIFPTFPYGYDSLAMRQDNQRLGFYICPPTSGNVFSRAALQQANLSNFDPRGAFDGSPALAMPYIGEITSLNEPLAFYRVHETSLSGWSKPTIKLLQREIDLFEKSWKEISLSLNLEKERLHVDPLYLRERRMMISCLNGQVLVFSLVLKFILGLLKTHLPMKQKVLFSFWSLSMLVPSTAFRSYCIKLKRSSTNRPKVLQTILGAMTGRRHAR